MRMRSPVFHRSALVLAAVLTGAFLLGEAATALAASYYGYGDTGWTHVNKRDCCEDAGWLAQDDSAWQCETAGGHPRIAGGSVRADCDWDTRGTGRNRVYRCTARANVYCR